MEYEPAATSVRGGSGGFTPKIGGKRAGDPAWRRSFADPSLMRRMAVRSAIEFLFRRRGARHLIYFRSTRIELD